MGHPQEEHIINYIFYGAINATTDPLFCDCLDMWCEHSILILQFLQFELKLN
jgi:hypothetical protein